ncbi:HD-GYP domain-containing protein [Celerinatantimonas yamalensis]|uniref:HD domain-containing phosphohydrolase n=1 Tax=Celerinatantimonas yamalensis TaxID=559956 RepID=A0ABW9G2D5_9GAMM
MPTTKIPLNKLTIGHYVNLPLSWTMHPFLRSSFKVKSEDELIVLRNLPFDEIDVDLDKSDIQVSVTIPSFNHSAFVAPIAHRSINAAEKFQQQQKRQQRKTERLYNDHIELLKNSISHLNSNPTLAYTEQLHCVENLCKSILTKQHHPNVYLILNAKNGDHIFQHSLNVAVLTILVAKTLNYHHGSTQQLALVALIQDLGMLRVPYQIRHKKTELSSVEKNYYQAHVGYSVELLRRASFPKELIELVALHHERLDGSGYPKGVNEMSEMAQLIQVTDYYDVLINPPPWQKAIPPQLAIAVLLKNAGKLFNRQVVEALALSLGIYPPGTCVQLDDKRYALVAASNPDDKLKPYVKVLSEDGDAQFDELPIDDLQMLNTTIKHTPNFEQLPENIAKSLSTYHLDFSHHPEGK